MNTFRRFMTSLMAAAMLLAMSVSAFAADIPEYTEAFYVNDYAQVISAQTEEKLCTEGYALSAATGAELVVVTVDFLGGMDIEDYAKKIFNDWQLGDPEKNNGVLLLLAIGEENYWAAQGKGLEDTLSSGKLGTILEEYLEPDFAAENYDAGVLKTYEKLSDELCQIYGITLTEDGNITTIPQQPVEYDPVVEKEPFPIGAVILIIIVIIAVIMLLMFISRINRPRPRHYGGSIPPSSVPPRTTIRRPTYHDPHIGGFGGGIGRVGRYNVPGHRPGSFTTSGRRTGGFSGRNTGSFGGSSGRSSFGGSSGRSSFGGSRGGRIGGGGGSRGGGAGRR